MAGHNKWVKVKHKKAATDAHKSKVFSKFARLIAVESKKAGGDSTSPGLRVVVEKARKENMPSENIQRAISRGISGESGGLEPVRYEAYGPGGVALIIEGLTDNKNRTGSEMKHLLSKHGLELAAPGSAAWAFEHKDGEWAAKTTTPLSEKDRAALALLLEELNDHDDVQEIYSSAAKT